MSRSGSSTRAIHQSGVAVLVLGLARRCHTVVVRLGRSPSCPSTGTPRCRCCCSRRLLGLQPVVSKFSGRSCSNRANSGRGRSCRGPLPDRSRCRRIRLGEVELCWCVSPGWPRAGPPLWGCPQRSSRWSGRSRRVSDALVRPDPPGFSDDGLDRGRARVAEEVQVVTVDRAPKDGQLLAALVMLGDVDRVE